MRKRSQGVLRFDGQEQDGGQSSELTKHGFPSKTRGRRLSLMIAVTVVISALIAAFYYFPSLTALTSLAESSGVHQQTSSLARGPNLDHPLHPEQHILRQPTTLYFDWRVTSGSLRPDGVLKHVYLINEEFLGPTIECRSGDRLVITVHNSLSDEGIALHWHGLSMRDQNAQDGAVGFTQNSIEPGHDFTYNFTVDHNQYGTFWYHAHSGVQRADGLFGGLIVHRPVEDDVADTDRYGYAEERLLIIGDWYHRRAHDVMGWYMRAASFGNEPVPDSILINGIGAYNCSLAVAARPVDCAALDGPGMSLNSSRPYRIRIINSGTLSGFHLRSNALSMTAIEVDGGNAVKGSAARSVGIIYPGQRIDLLLSVTASSEETMELEIELDRRNFRYPNPALNSKQRFPIEVGQREHRQIAGVLPQFDLLDVSSTHTSKPELARVANMSIVLYSTSAKMAHLGNKPHGFINQTSWKPQANPLRSTPRKEWDEYQFVPQLPLVSEADQFWVDIVLNNLDDGSHPFHIHGYDVFQLQTHAGFGWGSWNPFETSEPPGGALNVHNPVKRDTFYVPKHGYTVLRFRPDNPGIWMFHCHILWHQASGMAMGLQVGDILPAS